MSVPAIQMNLSPSLSELLHGLADTPTLCVTGIASDSRQVRAGFLFLACEGESSHGLDYLHEAIVAGASAVAWDPSTATAPVDTNIVMNTNKTVKENPVFTKILTDFILYK